MPPNTTRAYWKALTSVDVELIDTEDEMRVAKRYLDKLDPARNAGAIAFAVIEAHEAGLFDGRRQMKERLPPGGTPSGSRAYGENHQDRSATAAA